MTTRALSAKLRRLEAKVTVRWLWEVPLWCWPEEQRALLFAVISHRPGWLAAWPAPRHSWLCRALERNPHLFPDRVLEAIAAARPTPGLPPPPLLP
jgi:hypothetical protein